MAPLSSSPISRDTLKPAAQPRPKAALDSDGDVRVREGDEFWLRVMHTKESQWRFLNSLALHQMSHLEREACADITSLSTQLEQLQRSEASLSVLVSKCESIRAQQKLASHTAPVLRQLCDRLPRLRADTVSQVVHDARDAVIISESQSHLVACVDAFCKVASQFETRAKEEGLFSLADVAALLAQVLQTAVAEPRAVLEAADAVLRAGVASERQRSAMVASASVSLLREPKSLT